jgi:hypothetical protein
MPTSSSAPIHPFNVLTLFKIVLLPSIILEDQSFGPRRCYLTVLPRSNANEAPLMAGSSVLSEVAFPMFLWGFRRANFDPCIRETPLLRGRFLPLPCDAVFPMLRTTPASFDVTSV